MDSETTNGDARSYSHSLITQCGCHRAGNSVMTFGHCDLETAATYHDIACVLFEAGKYNEALGLCEQVLEIVEQILGSDHLATATAHFNLGEICRQIGGKLAESIGHFKAAFQIRWKILGQYDSSTVATMKSLEETRALAKAEANQVDLPVGNDGFGRNE